MACIFCTVKPRTLFLSSWSVTGVYSLLVVIMCRFRVLLNKEFVTGRIRVIFLLQLFRRLSSQGMTDFVEEQLLSMSWHIKKIHRHRIGSDTNEAANRMPDGKVC